MDFASAFSVGRMPEAKLNVTAAVALIRELQLPEPNAAQVTQIRTQMQQAALLRNAAGGQTTATTASMMDGSAAKSDKKEEYSAEAITVAYVLGSPQFQKR
jgi:hypothetical protein